MIPQDEQSLVNLLRFDQHTGQIFLKDYRMVMLSAAGLGALRKELVETLGWEQARGLMKRFGYAAGRADARALSERYPDISDDQRIALGRALHALEGVTKAVRIPEHTTIDLERGKYRVEGYWENSYEAEQHLAAFGKSDEPVCWTLMGYATGHSTEATGAPRLVVEVECRAMGREQCRFVADYDANLPAEFDLERQDYHTLHLPEVLRDLQQVIEKQQRSLERKEKNISRLRAELDQRQDFAGILGTSPVLKETLRVAELVAPVDSTVLILGESGTGKELLARGIHAKSQRADKAFVAVNCSALPETLQEAELFGYAKGAFTGASSTRAGLFEEANQGTLFLDEIGELLPSAQTKLLRALQEGEIKRIGENQPRKVDVRILAATNQDLEKMVREKRFREDLFYRLNVVSIELPPLRKRANDALILAEYFAKKFARQFSKKSRGISCQAARAIAAYAWPGNVRELEHAIERAVILSSGPLIELVDLPGKIGMGSTQAPGNEAVHDAQPPSVPHEELALAHIASESERLSRALHLAEGNRERAAKLLGMSRTTLWRKMKKWQVE